MTSFVLNWKINLYYNLYITLLTAFVTSRIFTIIAFFLQTKQAHYVSHIITMCKCDRLCITYYIEIRPTSLP